MNEALKKKREIVSKLVAEMYKKNKLLTVDEYHFKKELELGTQIYDAAIQAVIEMLGEFDKEAAEQWAINYRHENGEKGLPPYYRMARWQHAEMMRKLGVK